MQKRVERDGRGGSRGVSTVIGVVLIVAITVMLVGVVAVFATGFGDDVQQPAPNVATTTSFDDRWDPAGQYLNITHRSGQTIDRDDLRFDVDGAMSYDTATGATGTVELDQSEIEDQIGPEFNSPDQISINKSTFTQGGGALSSTQRVDLTDATVRIIYSHGAGERTDVLYECKVASPDCEENPV